MHRSRKLTGALPALAVLCLGAAADIEAQRVPSPFRFLERGQEAGVFAGYFGSDPGRFDFGPRGGPLLGARYGLEMSGPFGLEGVASLLPTTRDVIDPRRAEGDRKVDEAEAALVAVDARLRFGLTGRRTWHGIAPHFVVGGGVAFDVEGDQEEDQRLQETDRFDFGTAFLGVLGGGVRWIPGERLMLRADAHLTLWQLDTPEGFEDPDLGFESVPKSEWVNNGVLTLGLSYRF